MKNYYIGFVIKNKGFSVKSCFVKIKFNDFKTISNQKSSMTYEYDIFRELLMKMLKRNDKPVRLIGAGVQFSSNSQLKLNIFKNYTSIFYNFLIS